MKTSTNYYLFLLLLIGLIACETEDSPIRVTDTQTLYTTVVDDATGSQALQITDLGQGTGTVTWTADKTILLNGFVYVNAGQTLQIEPGTVIKGLPGEGDQASALVVARGATIIAEGTASSPIIFTAYTDSLNGNLGSEDRGLWGGLIILGAARLNSAPGVNSIEGIPLNEPRGVYGGDNDGDDSGVLRYISIRHGGTEISEDNEINGLTLAGVGSQSNFDYIEIYANKDDGIELFGGTAQLKNLIVAHCADDGIDYDEGYRGAIQFGLIFQSNTKAGHGGEHDGGTSPENGTPFATPTFYNITSIGSGLFDDQILLFRDNAGGKYHNSIFFNYQSPISIELLNSKEHSYKRLQVNDLQLKNNVFWNVPSMLAKIHQGSDVDSDAAISASLFLASYLTENNNVILDLGVRRDSPIPNPHSLALSTPTQSFFESTNYIGAFAPTQVAWFANWSKVAREF